MSYWTDNYNVGGNMCNDKDLDDNHEIITKDINKINTKNLGFLAKHGYYKDNTYHILKKEHMEYVNNTLLKDILEENVDKKYDLSKNMINNLLYDGE